AVFSPDGKLLATGSRDGRVKVWDVATGQERRTLTGHSHAVKSVAWSPDGRRFASASNDGTVRLWETATGREMSRFRHTEAANVDLSVYTVAWSPPGDLMADGLRHQPMVIPDQALGDGHGAIDSHTGRIPYEEHHQYDPFRGVES